MGKYLYHSYNAYCDDKKKVRGKTTKVPRIKFHCDGSWLFFFLLFLFSFFYPLHFSLILYKSHLGPPLHCIQILTTQSCLYFSPRNASGFFLSFFFPLVGVTRVTFLFPSTWHPSHRISTTCCFAMLISIANAIDSPVSKLMSLWFEKKEREDKRYISLIRDCGLILGLIDFFHLSVSEYF